MKQGIKYNLLAAIRGQSETFDANGTTSWFNCGFATVNKDGKLSLKIHGLPLPQHDWNGWLYIREATDFSSQKQGEYTAPPKKKAKQNKFDADYRENDIPF